MPKPTTRFQRGWFTLAICVLCIAACPRTFAAASPQERIAQRACAAIAGHAGAPQGPPEFLASYLFDDPQSDPALRTAAFTYDNALAIVALIACHRLPQAERIGEALRAAALAGPRLRNAYRAGPVTGAPLPNGWWDAKAKRWAEDPYQMGTATGIVAWAGLALLALSQATGQPRWRDAAAQLGRWIAGNTLGAPAAAGYTGGLSGFDAAPVTAPWKSTEHNIDATALFTWLARLDPGGGWSADAAHARRFVDSQWDARSGHFYIGTLPDGAENTGISAIDAQMWALLLPHAKVDWRRAVTYAETHYGVDDGFAFGVARDGVWVEGTAQAALVYRRLGTPSKAEAMFRTIASQFSPQGYLYATNRPRIATGLALGPGSSGADFHYYHRPHLAPTAWAALAALDWNPFVPHPQAGAPASP